MPMHNLIKYSDIYLNITRSLWQYYMDNLALRNAGIIIDFPADGNYCVLFKFKENITGKTGIDNKF